MVPEFLSYKQSPTQSLYEKKVEVPRPNGTGPAGPTEKIGGQKKSGHSGK